MEEETATKKDIEPKVVEKEVAERLESLVEDSVAIARRAWEKNLGEGYASTDREPIGRLADSLLNYLLEKEE